jgi:uncharacterized flavoprotein (TIGR03862 family)
LIHSLPVVYQGMTRHAVIIGGGPAGLMAAEVISAQGIKVDIYDAMPSVGRKFLMAGKSGLNITHSEPFNKFVSRYGHHQAHIEPLLKTFGPEQLLDWVHGLGIQTFTGSSGRVFPKEMKASPLLRAWLQRLNAAGVKFHLRHKLTRLSPGRTLHFDTPEGTITVKADVVLLALGGGSWRRLGSDGAWVDWLRQAGVKVAPLRPSNCGFEVHWSSHFKEKYEGHPVKSVIMKAGNLRQQGEFVITRDGIEGSLVYAASCVLRDEIEKHGRAVIHLDLAPDVSEQQLRAKLGRPRGSRSMANHLEKTTGIKGVKAGLLREFVPKEEFNESRLAAWIKNVPVLLVATSSIDKAISSAGGISFDSLDDHLMLKKIPGIFCAGEMLDWEAPTGGYLLTACFSSGYAAGKNILHWLEYKGSLQEVQPPAATVTRM